MGLDPGKSGGIAVIDQDGKVVELFVMPMIGKTYNIPQVRDFITKYPIQHAVLEDVHAHQIGGKTSAFEFGGGKFMLETTLVCFNIPYTMIQAKAWQEESWKGVRKVMVMNSKKVDTKPTSLIAAQRLFPGETFVPPGSIRATKPHDGIVDALLIAEFCRRKFK